MAAFAKPALPLVVKFEALGAGLNEMACRFRQEGIEGLMQDLLHRAGYRSGTWLIRIADSVRKKSVGGNTISLRHVDINGVHLNIKPQKSPVAAKCTIVVTKDLETTPEEVYDRLSGVLAGDLVADQGRPQPQNVAHIPIRVTEEEKDLLLMACADLHERFDVRTWPDINKFIEHVRQEVKLPNDHDHAWWLECMETLVADGLLHDNKNSYLVTKAGHAFLEETMLATSNEVSGVPAQQHSDAHPPTLPLNGKGWPKPANLDFKAEIIQPEEIVKEVATVVPEPVAPPVGRVADPVALILAKRDKLNALLELPAKLDKIRQDQGTVKAQIFELDRSIRKQQDELAERKKTLENLRAQEQQIAKSVDVEALAKLLG